eukprot:TRINITY_DN2626_c0_g1_i1.p1 TRINITY_DN2626_c0_g1~~TRINITY_DN2626_c0_g1_i1.p1  ORF type:complete len:368 (-),score=82.30 TRINITY_DN2626_c0_g1_i1:52-1155(-)
MYPPNTGYGSGYQSQQQQQQQQQQQAAYYNNQIPYQNPQQQNGHYQSGNFTQPPINNNNNSYQQQTYPPNQAGYQSGQTNYQSNHFQQPPVGGVGYHSNNSFTGGGVSPFPQQNQPTFGQPPGFQGGYPPQQPPMNSGYMSNQMFPGLMSFQSPPPPQMNTGFGSVNLTPNPYQPHPNTGFGSLNAPHNPYPPSNIIPGPGLGPVHTLTPHQTGFSIQLRGVKLDDHDFFTKSDPFFTISIPRHSTATTNLKVGKRLEREADWITVYRSETIMNTLNPLWREFTLKASAICPQSLPEKQVSDSLDAMLLLEVYDWEESSSNDFIGNTLTTLRDFQVVREIRLQNKRRFGIGSVAGIIQVLKCQQQNV